MSEEIDRDRPSNAAVPLEESEQASYEDEGTEQNETVSPGRMFKRMPELNNCFERGAWDKKRRAIITCLGCRNEMKTSDTMRLAKHITKCFSIPEEKREIIKHKLRNLPFYGTSEQAKKRDKQCIQILRIFTRYNCPLSIFNDTDFKKFMKTEAGLEFGDRNTMARKYLRYEANQRALEMNRVIETSDDYSISIEFDHFRDLSHRSILAILATISNGARIIIALDDVTYSGKRAQDILEPLKKKLEKLPTKKLNSVISDSASSCKLAREQLCLDPDFKHIIQHRCLAHLLNSMGDHLSEQSSVKPMIITATKLVSFINNHEKIAAKLKQAGHNRLSKATETRWYSLVNMLEELYKVKSDAELLLKDYHEQEAQEMHDELIFLNDMSNAIRIFRPLANCIAIAEKADGNVGETVKAILEFAKSLFVLNWGNRTVLAGIDSFLTYICPKKLGDELYLILAAYCIDRRNKVDYLTDYAFTKIFIQLRLIAKKSRCSERALNMLAFNFKQFCRQEGEYSKLPEEDTTALDWWRSVDSSSSLKRVAMRLSCLKPSSANTERQFSDIKQAQGLNRTNYSIETLRDLMIVRQSMRQEPQPSSDDEMDDETQSSSQKTPTPAFRRRSPPKNLITQVSIHSDDSQRVDDQISSQLSDVSTLTNFSYGLGESELSELGPESLAAYREFKKLIDFRLVTVLRDDTSSPDNAIDDNDDEEASEQFKNLLQSQ